MKLVAKFFFSPDYSGSMVKKLGCHSIDSGYHIEVEKVRKWEAYAETMCLNTSLKFYYIGNYTINSINYKRNMLLNMLR